MARRYTRVLLVVLLAGLLVTQSLVVAGGVRNPRFEASVPEPTLTPGAEQTVTVELTNDADDPDDVVEDATDVTVEARAGDTPFTVQSGPRFLGRMSDGQRESVPVRLVVPTDVDPGTYRLRLRVSYVRDFDEDETRTVTATVRVPERPRLRVIDTETDLAAGDRGTVTVTVQNVGTTTARDARLALSTDDADLELGGGTRASRLLGDLGRFERETVEVAISATGSARSERYPLAATATFTDQDGFEVSQDLGAVGVTPRPALDFTLREVRSDLTTGVEGRLQGVLVNDGDRVARAAIVELTSPSETLRFPEPATPVGDVEPDGSSAFSVPIAVPATADGGPRPVTVAVTYELDSDGEVDRRRTVVRTLSVPVSDEDLLAVTATNTTYRPGTDGRLRVTVENVGDRRLTDIEPRLSATPPFASDAPGAYVDSLAPGESRAVAFPMTVAGDAVASTHSLPVNVTATTADGDTVRSGTQDVPVTIVDTDLLAVTAVNATIPPDTDGHLDVRVENVGSVTLTDLTPRIAPTPPFTSEGPRSYVPRLPPGESAVVTFQLTVAEDAVPSTQSVRLNATATTPDDDTVRSGPHEVAVRIEREETAGSTLVLIAGAVVVVALLGVGWWWLND